MQEVTIDIGPAGEVTVGVKGVSGPDCAKLTAEIERAVGEVEQRTKTAEFAKQPEVLRKK